MKKPRFFISVSLFFLFTSLCAQTPPYIATAAPDSIAPADSLSDIQRFELISYEEQLNKMMTVHSPSVELFYYGVDTSAKQLFLDTRFELPQCLISAMIRDFRSDTSLPPVAEPCIRGSDRNMFQFGKMTLKWNSLQKAFISEGPLPLLAIGKNKINKLVNGYVMVEKRRSGNTLTIYLENGKGGWYTCCYSNGIMLIYTPDEKLKSKIAKHPVKRGKSPGPRYRTALGSPSERNLLFKKLKRGGVLHETNRSSTNGKTDPPHTRADTLRIDSITEAISKLSVPGLYTSSITKTFDCEESSGQGTVTVSTGENLIKLEVFLCGSDHGSSSSTSVFYYGNLVDYYEESGSWSFDPEHSTDSTSATLDETIFTQNYFQDGVTIKTVSGQTVTYNYDGTKKINDNTAYYFDHPEDEMDKLEFSLNEWIKFAHSTKSYAEFFENAGK